MNYKNLRDAIIMAFICLNFNQRSFGQAEGGKLIMRDQIDPKYTWNLKDIYALDDLWEKDFKWVETNIPNYKNHEGKLGSSANELLAVAKFDDSISVKIQRLYLYASCSRDLDLSNSINMARHDRISQLASKGSVASSFIRPELLAIPKEKINKFLEESKELRVYKHQIDDLFRSKEHTLPKEQEEILARSSEISQVPENAFSIFTDAEMKFPTIKDPSGNDIQLSSGRYRAAMFSSDRAYRERVYKNFNSSYIEYKNTLATLFNGEIKTHIFYAQSRKFNSCIDAALNDNNIPVSVYKNLVKTANENLTPLYRWRKIRKQVLGLQDYHRYDDAVTLFPAVKKEYTYDQAMTIVKEALKPLGSDYIKNISNAFDNRWIDVYETKGKRSGAYSSGVTFGTHPYVLLNWNNQLDDVFTLAHEMGHNMHSYYTEQSQPFPYANYSIFVAEVASTCNEALLLDYMIKRAETKEEKLALIEKYIMDIVSTFYRQVVFAEFEMVSHEKAEKGEALTAESLTQLFKEISLKYWSNDMKDDAEESYTWSRIPHFYMNFYVYQYATSFAASQVIAEKIETEKQPAIDKYLKFLKSGSSDYPIEILKEAGVDMSSPEPIIKTIKKMDELLDQMENLLKEK